MINFNILISYLAAASTAVLALYVIRREAGNFAGRVLSLGLGMFALEAFIMGYSFTAGSFESLYSLLQLKIIAASALPIIWLLFSLSFARTNFEEFIFKWRWVLSLTFIVPFGAAIFFNNYFFVLIKTSEHSPFFVIKLGWAGYIWYLSWLICAVLILMNLERTMRHVTGHMQWQIKFMILGIAGIFAIRIYTYSQVMIFQRLDMGFELANVGILLVANILLARSFMRGKLREVQIQLSQTFLYQSFTVLITGIYFIGSGLLAWFTLQFGGSQNLQLATFLVFVALLGYASLMMSGRLRMERKRFISYHFKKPKYDYRTVWERFTMATATLESAAELSDFIARITSDTLEAPSVSVWVIDEKTHLLLSGSTILNPYGSASTHLLSDGGLRLIQAMESQKLPVDLNKTEDDWIEDLRLFYGDALKKAEIMFCVPLSAAGEQIGIMTIGSKVSGEPLSLEDNELLKTIANQTAASLLNRNLLKKLRKVQELETFQTMSSFFMHDFKNLAYKLSLVTQNLPIHVDNPDFRQDAIRTISESVYKMNAICNRLSYLSKKLELEKKETDLNDLLDSIISRLSNTLQMPIVKNYKPTPMVLLDPEQFDKVIENLLMNAKDAVGTAGEITVASSCNGQWAEVVITDNGCGMSKEFIANRLFHPFQTTKKQGMGIGLFHCKTIVEAHGGFVEVESEEGKGSTFKVKLPVANYN